EAVQAYVDTKRPVTDNCIVFAPTLSPVNFSIAAPASVQASISAALAELMSRTDLSAGLSFQDQVIPAVASGAATQPFEVTLPAADVPGSPGILLALGTITYSSG